MAYPLYSYAMVGQLPTPPYQTVNWLVYGTPDMTGAQSGYAGLQNIAIASQQQIQPPTNAAAVDAQIIQGVPVASNPPVPVAGQTLVITAIAEGVQYTPTTFARGFATNAANVYPDSATATIVASVTVTPTVTGKLRVIATGTFANGSGTSAVSVGSALSQGATATGTTLWSNGPTAILGATGAVGADVPFSITVDLDKATCPAGSSAAGVVYPVGTPVQINFVIQLGSMVATVGVPACFCQLTVEEKP